VDRHQRGDSGSRGMSSSCTRPSNAGDKRIHLKGEKERPGLIVVVVLIVVAGVTLVVNAGEKRIHLKGEKECPGLIVVVLIVVGLTR